MPIAEAPKDPPKGDIAVGQTPTGKALKFAYRGSFHQMEDTIYNAIPEYLDEKQLDPSGTFIEEYQTDPVTTPEDKFDIHDLRADEVTRRCRSAFRRLDSAGPAPRFRPLSKELEFDVPPTGPRGRRQPPDSAMRPRALKCFEGMVV